VKRFQFPFERLMDWRDKVAEQERVRLQRLHGTRSEFEAALARLQVNIGECEVRPASGHDLHATDLQQAASYVQALRRQQETVGRKKQECQTAIVRQTALCVSTKRDHELLVRLRDRRFTAWGIELNRETENSAADCWLAGRARSSSLRRCEE
jgi:hypothetical protein